MKDEWIDEVCSCTKEAIGCTLDLDKDCIKADIEIDPDDEGHVEMTVEYHSKDWPVSAVFGEGQETEFSLEERLMEIVGNDVDDVLWRYGMECSNVDVNVSSMFDFVVAMQCERTGTDRRAEADSTDLF